MNNFSNIKGQHAQQRPKADPILFFKPKKQGGLVRFTSTLVLDEPACFLSLPNLEFEKTLWKKILGLKNFKVQKIATLNSA